MKYIVTLQAVVELPDKRSEREELYGTFDPETCVKADFENDPAFFLLEQCEDAAVTGVFGVGSR